MFSSLLLAQEKLKIFYSNEADIVQYKVADIEHNVKYELAIRDELIFLFNREYNNVEMRMKNNIKFVLPFNLHIVAGIKFLNQYKIDFRFGFIADQDYILGFEEGIFFKAKLFNTNYFGTAGVYFFNNSLASDGITETGGEFTFYCIGLGYETSQNFSLDITYCFPGGNKVYAKEPTAIYGIGGGQFFDKSIGGLMRIGFQYSFIFN